MDPISITIYNRSSVRDAATIFPVTFTLGFTEGELTTQGTPPLCMYDIAGGRVPTQVEVLARYGQDDSVRLVQLVALVPMAAARMNFVVGQGNHQDVYVSNLPASILLTVNVAGKVVTYNMPKHFWGLEELFSADPSVRSEQISVAMTARNFGDVYELDVLAYSNNAAPKKLALTLYHEGMSCYVRWDKFGYPVSYGAESTDLCSNITLYDLNGHWRKLYLVNNSAVNAASLAKLANNPPVAVMESVHYLDKTLGSWPFRTFPTSRALTPSMSAPVKADEVGRKFRLPGYDRLVRSCVTGGWPYPSDEFVATGSPGELDKQLQWAMGETTVLPQSIFFYRNDEWSTLKLDEAPYCGGSWRAFGVKRHSDSFAARDGQHGWHYHVFGAWEATGDPVLGEWLTAAAHMRIPELLQKTRYPSDSERAIAHALSIAIHGYIVSGDPVILDAIRERVLSLFTEDNWSVSYGTWYGSFKTGMLMRALIGAMEVLGPDDMGYWRALQWIAAQEAWNRRYGNFPYEKSTADVWLSPLGTSKSSITSLTWVDPVAWYAFEWGSPKAWSHLQKYMNKGLGDKPTGNFDTWTGQYENRYYQDVKRDKPVPSRMGTPSVKVLTTTEETSSVHASIELPTETLRYIVVHSTLPIVEELAVDPKAKQDPNVRCWWAAALLQGGAIPESRLVDISLPRRTDGKPRYVAVLAWNGAGQRSPLVVEMVQKAGS